jgi:hypothetical protein
MLSFDKFLQKSIYYFQISDGVCNACNGYYGPAHGQSVCPTCHAFLYANDLDLEVNVELASVERDGEDSDSGKNFSKNLVKSFNKKVRCCHLTSFFKKKTVLLAMLFCTCMVFCFKNCSCQL